MNILKKIKAESTPANRSQGQMFTAIAGILTIVSQIYGAKHPLLKDVCSHISGIFLALAARNAMRYNK